MSNARLPKSLLYQTGKEKFMKEIKSATLLNMGMIRNQNGCIADMKKIVLIYREDQITHYISLS